MPVLNRSIMFIVMIATLGSCTISFLPRNKELLQDIHRNPPELTGSLKVSWRIDTLSTVGYRLFTEAAYTSLYDTRVSLQENNNIKFSSSRIAEFVFEDLNPGNYVIELFSRQRRGSSGSGKGRTVSLQVTAGRQRAYSFDEDVAYFPTRPGRSRAEIALKGIMGLYDCAKPTESVYVNQRFPNSIEKFDPMAERVLNFESSFNDTVVVLVNQKVVAKKYMDSNSSGLAGQLKIMASPDAVIAIRTTPNDCVEFSLKDGYKYLFINRYPIRKWDISYSNSGRAYY